MLLGLKESYEVFSVWLLSEGNCKMKSQPGENHSVLKAVNTRLGTGKLELEKRGWRTAKACEAVWCPQTQLKVCVKDACQFCGNSRGMIMLLSFIFSLSLMKPHFEMKRGIFRSTSFHCKHPHTKRHLKCMICNIQCQSALIFTDTICKSSQTQSLLYYIRESSLQNVLMF